MTYRLAVECTSVEHLGACLSSNSFGESHGHDAIFLLVVQNDVCDCTELLRFVADVFLDLEYLGGILNECLWLEHMLEDEHFVPTVGCLDKGLWFLVVTPIGKAASGWLVWRAADAGAHVLVLREEALLTFSSARSSE